MFTFEQSVIHHLLLTSHSIKEPGLFYGKIGVAIAFFRYGRKNNNQIFLDQGNELIEGILDDVNHKVSFDFATGLAGIAWGIEYLVQNKFVEGNTNLICSELDQKISSISVRRLSDLSLETGLEGILHYLLARIKGSFAQNNRVPFDYTLLDEIQETIVMHRKKNISHSLNELFTIFGHYYSNHSTPLYILNPESLYISTIIKESIEDNPLGLRRGLAGWLCKN